MGIGTSLLLIAIGAILAFAINTTEFGPVEVGTIGVILMIVGLIGLLISLVLMSQARDRGGVVARDRVVERDPRV